MGGNGKIASIRKGILNNINLYFSTKKSDIPQENLIFEESIDNHIKNIEL